MNTCRISLALSLAICSGFAAAAPAQTSAYNNDPQSSAVEDVTSEGISQVNRLTCILAGTRPEALVNQGTYTALVDESKCDSGIPSATSNADESGSIQTGSYLRAVVDASRASNDDPMISKAWIDKNEDGGYQGIDVHVSASEAPSIANPYGVFRLDFCGLYQTGPYCLSEGYLQAANDGIGYFQSKQRETEHGTVNQFTALRLNASGTTAGSGRMHVRGIDDNARYFDMDFAFSYNPTLFRRATSDSDACFSRDASDPGAGISVYRYGLYDADTGARVTRNSGFVFEYNRGGSIYRSYLGYYGLSSSSPIAFMDSGSTVHKIDSADGQAPVSTPYTFIKAAGKLTKYTRQVRTLRSIDKVRFTSSFSVADAQRLPRGLASPGLTYEQYWDDAAGVFKVTPIGMCQGSGVSSSRVGGWQTACLPIGQEQEVPLSFYQARGGFLGWSQFLDADLSINLQSVTAPLDSAAVAVSYRTQELVYPSELPTNLFCLRDCPTAATLNSYFSLSSPSPFVAASINNVGATPASNVVQYHTDNSSALLVDATDRAVTYTYDLGSPAPPEAGWGVRTGRLFPTLAATKCADDPDSYCESAVDGLEIYYQWATGPSNDNQFAGLQDSNGDFVRFEAPLRITFDVPTDAPYGEYAGRNIDLMYSGFGQLSGIPTVCISRMTNERAIGGCADFNTYPVPAFAIPFDVMLGKVASGETTYLVKWLKRGIRFARKDASSCSAAGLDLPGEVVLPSVEDLKNPAHPISGTYIGTKPDLDGPPRVIDGEVKF